MVCVLCAVCCVCCECCVLCVVCVPLRGYSDECLGSIVDHRVRLFPRNIVTYREEEVVYKGRKGGNS